MRYLSTRGGIAPKAFCEILLEGLAPDGGLCVPESYPQFDAAQLAELRSLDYPSLAYRVISQFITDVDSDDLRALLARTYTAEVFGSPDITPVRAVRDGVWIQALSNGPTLAFKDIAMQFLGQLFQYVLERNGETLNILGATSGDTGSSAEYAMLGKANVRVFMLSPLGKMSPFQTAQMFSLQQPNIFNLAVRGVFDDCQDMVKAIGRDAEFKSRYKIGAVNSINWARIVAQAVYYFKGYFAVSPDTQQPVDFVVPSGNFGNVFAGYIAKRMGLPIGRLIVATNENDVLDEFFRTGVYRVRPTEQVYTTTSPSMDISKASNFERYIYDLAGSELTAQLWQQVEQQGYFDLRGTPLWEQVQASGLVSGRSTHADRMATIRQVYQTSGQMIDTHTADGLKVGLEWQRAGVPLVCLETALPAKFEASIVEALGVQPPRPEKYHGIEQLPQRFEVIDVDAEALKRYVAQQVMG